MIKSKSSSLLTDAEIKQRADEISIILKKDRVLLVSYSKLLRELGYGKAVIEKRIKMGALVRQWIVLDREYRHHAKTAFLANRNLKFITAFMVAVGAFGFYLKDQLSQFYGQPIDLSNLIYFVLFIIIYINLNTNVKAAEDNKVEAFWRKNAIALKIERETGCDLSSMNSDTSCLPNLYPYWQDFQDKEVMRLSQSLQIKWCRKLANYLQPENELNELEYSQPEHFATSWNEKVFADELILIHK